MKVRHLDPLKSSRSRWVPYLRIPALFETSSFLPIKTKRALQTHKRLKEILIWVRTVLLCLWIPSWGSSNSNLNRDDVPLRWTIHSFKIFKVKVPSTVAYATQGFSCILPTLLVNNYEPITEWFSLHARV